MHPTQAISSVLSSQALSDAIPALVILWSYKRHTLTCCGCLPLTQPWVLVGVDSVAAARAHQRSPLTSLMQLPSSFRSCTGSCILISSFRDRPFTSSPWHFHGHRSPPPTSVQPSLLSSSGSSRAEQLLRFCTESPVENVDLVWNSLELKQSVKKQLL